MGQPGVVSVVVGHKGPAVTDAARQVAALILEDNDPEVGRGSGTTTITVHHHEEDDDEEEEHEEGNGQSGGPRLTD